MRKILLIAAVFSLAFSACNNSHSEEQVNSTTHVHTDGCSHSHDEVPAGQESFVAEKEDVSHDESHHEHTEECSHGHSH